MERRYNGATMSCTTRTLELNCEANFRHANTAGYLKRSVLLLALTLSIVAEARSEVITHPASIEIAAATCIPQVAGFSGACSDPQIASGMGVWRVVDWLFGGVTTGGGGMPGDQSLYDVTLTFVAGSFQEQWTWDRITVQYVETEPFNLSLLTQFTSLSLTATLPNGGVFDPLDPRYPDTKFVADNTVVSATAFTLPPPLRLSASGQIITTVPEPSGITLASIGMALVMVGGLLGKREWVVPKRSDT